MFHKHGTKTNQLAYAMNASEIAIILETMRAQMASLATSIRDMEAELVIAREAERTVSVQDAIRNLTYKTVTSSAIRCGNMDVNGTLVPVHQQTFQPFIVPERTYHIGFDELPMTVFLKAKVCNLSEYMRGVFQAKGLNIFEKVENFLADKWEDLATYNLYTLAIDQEARNNGRKKVDLPNVNFALTILFLTKLPNHDFVVSDPIFKGTDASVRVINYSHALRKLKEMNVRVQTFKNVTNDATTGLDVVLYQRGTGVADHAALAAIYRATGLVSENIMAMYLVPGKESIGIMGGNCYRDFAKSAGLILHELGVIDEYVRSKGKQYINDVKFVLDPFSGYAAFTAVAVLGYGLENMFHVLTGRYVGAGINKVLTFTAMAPSLV